MSTTEKVDNERDDELEMLRAEVEDLRQVVKLMVATASDYVPEDLLTTLANFKRSLDRT